MISAPSVLEIALRDALTAPCVPTGMNAGVCTTPCGGRASRRGARRRRGARTRNRNGRSRASSIHSGSPCESCLRVTVSCILSCVKRLRVGVLYGGRSGEHEVSLASAAAVFANLDRKRYEPVPIRIEKDGRWALADKPPTATSAAEVIEQARLEAARQIRERPRSAPRRAAERGDHPLDRSRAGDARRSRAGASSPASTST